MGETEIDDSKLIASQESLGDCIPSGDLEFVNTDIVNDGCLDPLSDVIFQ